MHADRSAAPRIALLHDDDVVEAAKLAAALGDRGFEVSQHPSGPSTLAELSASPPDLVVVDTADGWRQAEPLTSALPSTPVLLLTSPSRPAAPEGVLLVMKPASVDALASAIEGIFSRVPRQTPGWELHRDRLALLGKVTAALSHDINNMLTSLMSSLYSLVDATRGDGDSRTLLDDALDDADQIRLAMTDAQNLARTDEPADGADEVPGALAAALRLAQPQLRGRATIVTQSGPTPEVRAPDGRLIQLFLNLILNAAEAFPPAPVADSTITIVLGASDRGDCVIEIDDTGPGIPPEHLPRLFDPFFTTRAATGHTGLGLTLSRAIASSLGGTITVASTVGRGTTVRVALPASGEGDAG